MKENNKILVSIINWNNNKATSDCLESIAKIAKTDQPDIRLIDNNSTSEALDLPDKTTKKLRKIEIIKNKQNIGFAKAHNQSIKFALEHNYDFICLLNNDTVLNDTEVFKKLSNALGDTDEALASAPTILDADGKIWFAGGSFNKLTSTPSHNMVGQSPEKLGKTSETEHITGCCLMINLELLKESRLFLPEEYFMYWEDAEWSFRARKSGNKLIYVPNAEITHNISSSLGLSSPTYIYYNIRNNILFIKRNIGWLNRPLSYLGVLKIDAKYEIKALQSGYNTFKSVEKALLKGWKDGLSNKTGKL